ERWRVAISPRFLRVLADDAEFTIRLETSDTHLRDAFDAVLAQFGKDLFRCDPLVLEIASHPLSIADQGERRGFYELSHRSAAEGKPIQRNVPEHERCNEHNS